MTPVQRVLRLATVRLAVPRARIGVVALDRAYADHRFAELSVEMAGAELRGTSPR